MIALFHTIDLALNLYTWVLIISAIFSWLYAFNVINTYNDFVRQVLFALQKITEPVYRPVRRIMPDFGQLDLSPLVVLLLIYIARMVIGYGIVQAASVGV